MADTTTPSIPMAPMPLLTMTGRDGSTLTIEQGATATDVLIRIDDPDRSAFMVVDAVEAWRLAHLLPTVLSMLPAR